MGYGVLVWVILFVVISALVGFGIYNNQITKGIVVLVAGGLAYWFASKLGMNDWGKAVGLAVIWVAIALILDYLISARFASGLFSSRALWASYALIAIGALAGSMWGKKQGGSPMPM